MQAGRHCKKYYEQRRDHYKERINQITDLIAEGVDGIHLYTMNNAYIAHRIYDAVQNLISANSGYSSVNSK